MLIKTFQVQHYKSLSNVQIEGIPQLLLLVGQNASGKSNIINALSFLRDAVKDSLDHAISVRGGIDILRQYSPTKPYKISFRVEFEQWAGNELAYYELKIVSLGAGSYRVEREEAGWFEEESLYVDEEGETSVQSGRFHRRLTRDSKGVVRLDKQEMKSVFPEDELCIGARAAGSFGRLAFPIFSGLVKLQFASLYPNVLRNPSRPETDRFLKENGENWASVLKSMRKTERGKRSLNRILEMMRRVMPTLVDVHVKSVSGYLAPQFLVRDKPSAKGHYFDPIQLSDGTLRVFGLLLALYQNPPSSFLAVEEPEQTINPAMLGVLADAFKEVSHKSQLLITTHSPDFVDYFDASSIRVVSMENGETFCKSIKSTQIEAVKRRLTSLREMMSMDGLYPE